MVLWGGCASAQTTVPVLMLSDIHFDPFHDPTKVQQLRQTPIEGWAAILNGPETPGRDARQTADRVLLEGECLSRDRDTAWPLLQTTLKAAHAELSRPLFITLSGDLLTHEFPCRFAHAAHDAKPGELAAFSAKTVAFVVAQVRQAFPRVPVYVAVGNNDSGCNDYRETADSPFLQQTAEVIRQAAKDPGLQVTPEGDYSVALPAPILHGRLIVLDDVFASRDYASCGGGADRTPERTQMDWLQAQLAAAEARHEQVWVMAHIPPGADVYTSFSRYVLRPSELCNVDPRSYLADTALADTLLNHAGNVRLALFGHTHMDEIRLLRRDASAAGDATPAVIPAKLVPSISPFAGNHPAFVIAAVDPRTAVLKDWRTFVSPGTQGSSPPWTEAYRFTTAYHLPDFSAGSAARLADGFTQDKTGKAEKSSVFREHFYPGDIGLYALGLAQIWPAYACTVREYKPSAVHSCICGVMGKAAPEAP